MQELRYYVRRDAGVPLRCGAGGFQEKANIVEVKDNMGLRYEEVSERAVEMLLDIKVKYFPELKNAKIKLLFDLKKRLSGGRLVVGHIIRTNDLLRHLTMDEAEAMEGYDYIIVLDKLCWENIPDDDRIKILRHELRHTFVDIEAEKSPYKLQNHTINDFYEEVELNQDNPRWRDRVAAVAESIYEQQKEAKGGKGRKKGSNR
jgi:hypothetical protein